jgi:DNA-binding NarL/FixJ family response regulator
MSLLRIVLVEDHTLVRAGLHALLQKIPDVEVVAEAGDGREALLLIETHQPDIVLLDIAVPRLNGIEIMSRTAKQFPQVRVIVLSMYGNEEYVLQALRAGASGYLLKDSSTTELELAIEAVKRGEVYLSPPVSKYLVRSYVQRVGGQPRLLDRLTPRQREVLQLIAEGYSTQQIAEALTVSVKTVETHRMQLMERLDIHDTAGLTRFAIQTGLIPPVLPGAAGTSE